MMMMMMMEVYARGDVEGAMVRVGWG
jgi:hypothetical protein